MKNLTSLTAKEILKYKPTKNTISQIGVVNGNTKSINRLSIYFDGKTYFITKGLLFYTQQNHKIESKGSFEKITNYILSIVK